MTSVESIDARTVTRRRHDLGGRYDLVLVDGPEQGVNIVGPAPVSATVPGQVHTDLMAAGLLDDPDVGFGERDQMWIGHSTWKYSRTFEWHESGAARVDLVADGLDTVAEVLLNGHIIARTADQHVRYRWDVRDHLRGGDNLLEVVFTSAWAAAEAREREFGPLPTPYDEPYPYIRKSACNFGWDWGPHYVTAGIWQPIAIEEWSGRIENVRPSVTIGEDVAHVSVVTGIDLTEGVAAAVAVTLRDPDGREVASGRAVASAGSDATVDLVVPAPRLWWPAGYGDQPLYELSVALLDDEGASLDAWTKAIGIRSIRVVTSPDEVGERWALEVNGRRIRVRGYNWIPDDPFIAEVTDERLAQRLDQAVAGNANILRVWGGGYFATEAFMDGCDERGLLVWHDFLFACAAYDETGGMADLVRTEAEQAVARLARHASMAIWCGGNEAVWGSEEWGWEDSLGEDRTWGHGFYTQLLPDVVERLDPMRAYVPNSPWSTLPGALVSAHESGPTHLWDTWNNRDFATYRDSSPAFVSEMGWCAPPATTTLRAAVTTGPLLPDNPEVAFHMRASEGMHKLARGIQPHFPPSVGEGDWLFHTQLVQAYAQQVGTEWLRSRDRNAGVIVWQLNDCWPVLSWSAVDAAGVEKPLWYALRSAFAPRVLTIQPVTPGNAQRPGGTDGLELGAINDTSEGWTLPVMVRRYRFDGTAVSAAELTLVADADANGRIRLPDDLATPADERDEFLVADADGHRAVWAFVPNRRRRQPDAEWTVTTTGATVTVQARSFVSDLTLFADVLAANLGLAATDLRSDDQLITLLPGEAHTFRLEGSAAESISTLDAALFARGRGILRASNDIPLGSA